jgi:uncharacterized membrane protein
MVACCLIAAFAPAASSAPEDEEIPQLRAYYEDRLYELGEQVNFTLKVTANGRPVIPDAVSTAMAILINLTFGQQPSEIVWVTVTPAVGKRGEFTGNFNVTADNVTRIDPMGEGLPITGKAVVFMAVSSYKGVRMNTLGFAWVESGPKVATALSNPMPSPGETVEITVTTYNESLLVDAHDVYVRLRSYDGVNELDLGTLTVNRQSLGTYKASYSVPIDLAIATDYYVITGASFPDYNHSRYMEGLFAQVFSVRFFDIWGQNVSMDDTSASVAMWVADDTGQPVAGAMVDIDVTWYDDGTSTTEHLSNQTGTEGSAGFTISHISADRIDLRGNVTHGGLVQNFMLEGMVDKSPPGVSTPDEPDGLSVEPWEGPDNLPFFDNINLPGEKMSQKYRVYNGTDPFPNKRVNWYIIDQESFFDFNYTVVESGFEVTDANGDMTVEFTVPSSDVNAWIMFEANMWVQDEQSGEWSEETSSTSEPIMDTGVFPISEDIEITVNRVQKGAPIEMRVKRAMPRNSLIGLMVMPFDEDTGVTNWGSIRELGPGEDDMFISQLPKVGPDTYGLDYNMPTFVPEDLSWGFVGLTVNIDLFRIEANYVVLKYGESTEKGVDASQPVPPEPVHAGTNGTFTIEVENTGLGTDTYTIDTSATPWFVPEVDEVTLGPGEIRRINITVVVPEGTDEMPYQYDVTILSSKTAVNITLTIDVEVMVNGVEAALDKLEETAFRDETASFVLTLKNTGQGYDNFTLTTSGEASSWVVLGQTKIEVPEDGEGQVVIDVNVPANADEDDYSLSVTATSDDGETSDIVDIIIRVLVDAVDVQIAAEPLDALRGETVVHTVRVVNNGQGPDTFTLALSGDEPDWASLDQTTVEVEEGAYIELTLTVDVPDDADEGWYDVNVTATSANGITAATGVAVTHVWVRGVGLSTDTPSKSAYRGDTIEFGFNITNTGQWRDVYTLSHDAGDWASFVAWGVNPVGIPLGSSGGVGITIGLTNTVDEGSYTITVTATSEDGVTTATLEFTIEVTFNDIEATLSSTSEEVKQGKKVTFTLTLKNTGQGEDTYTVILLGPVSEWVDLETFIYTVAEGATKDINITVEVPKKADKGDQLLNITVRSSDPNFSDEAQFQVTVKEVKDEPGPGALAALAAVVLVASLLAVSRRRRR